MTGHSGSVATQGKALTRRWSTAYQRLSPLRRLMQARPGSVLTWLPRIRPGET